MYQKKKEYKNIKKNLEMNNIIKLIIVLYALALLGCLIANLVVGLDIQTNSKRAADASVIAAQQALELNEGLTQVKNNLIKLYEWIIAHLEPDTNP